MKNIAAVSLLIAIHSAAAPPSVQSCRDRVSRQVATKSSTARAAVRPRRGRLPDKIPNPREALTPRAQPQEGPPPEEEVVGNVAQKNERLSLIDEIFGTDEGEPPKLGNPMPSVLSHLTAERVDYSDHAYGPMAKRKFTYREIAAALKEGTHEPKKDAINPEYNVWNYTIRGTSYDGKPMRIVVSFGRNHMSIVKAMIIEPPRRFQ